MMDEIQLFDIYDYHYIPFWHAVWFKIIIALACIALIALCASYAMHYYKKRKNTALRRALAAINALEIKPEQSKDFYLQLSWHMKHYFSDLYSMPLTTKTDREVVELLAQHQQFSSDDCAIIVEIFLGSEQVKFARVQGITQKMARDKMNAYSMVLAKKAPGGLDTSGTL